MLHTCCRPGAHLYNAAEVSSQFLQPISRAVGMYIALTAACLQRQQLLQAPQAACASVQLAVQACSIDLLHAVHIQGHLRATRLGSLAADEQFTPDLTL